LGLLRDASIKLYAVSYDDTEALAAYAAARGIDLQRSELRDWIQPEWVERRVGSEGSDRKVARRTEGEAAARSLRA
jgi:hypothetical protein